jgi:hypothetical protein
VGDARTISAAHARGEAMRKSEQPLCLRANDKVNRYMNPPHIVPKVRSRAGEQTPIFTFCNIYYNFFVTVSEQKMRVQISVLFFIKNSIFLFMKNHAKVL